MKYVKDVADSKEKINESDSANHKPKKLFRENPQACER